MLLISLEQLSSQRIRIQATFLADEEFKINFFFTIPTQVINSNRTSLQKPIWVLFQLTEEITEQKENIPAHNKN
jgi:hypothetical protein